MNIPPWSYSALNTFENCPKQYHWRYILKNKSADTDATRHGTEVHTALEKRVKDGTPLPHAYREYDHFCQSILAHPRENIKVELPLAIDKEFIPCDFFGKNVWGRGKADIAILNGDKAWIGDWKTGKVREKEFQVKVFAAFIFKMFPQIKDIIANNIWLTANKIGASYKFTRAQEPVIWNEILHKINRIELAAENNNWPAKPSGLCGFCEVKDCVHNNPRRY